MNKTRLALLTLLTFITMFALSIFYNRFFISLFVDTSLLPLRKQPIILFVILGYLLLSVAMVFLFKFYKAKEDFVTRGIKFGLVIGFLWSIPINLIFYGVYDVSLGVTIIDSLWSLIEQAIGGIVISWGYNFS